MSGPHFLDPAWSSADSRDPSTDPLLRTDTGRAPVRVLFYSHDTFGLGHLRRCLKLSEAFARNAPDVTQLLITGSPVVHRFTLPPRVDYIKLPAARKNEISHRALAFRALVAQLEAAPRPAC